MTRANSALIVLYLALALGELADGMRTIGSACVNNANSGIEPNLVHQFVFNDFAEGDATATFVDCLSDGTYVNLTEVPGNTYEGILGSVPKRTAVTFGSSAGTPGGLIANSSVIDLGTGNFTITFWFKIPAPAPAARRQIFRRDLPTSDLFFLTNMGTTPLDSSKAGLQAMYYPGNYALHGNASGFLAYSGIGVGSGSIYEHVIYSGLDPMTSFDYSQWHLYTWTRDASSTDGEQLFLDGVNMLSGYVHGGALANLSPASNLVIGGYPVSQMDDIRIYNRVFSAADVLSYFTTNSGFNPSKYTAWQLNATDWMLIADKGASTTPLWCIAYYSTVVTERVCITASSEVSLWETIRDSSRKLVELDCKEGVFFAYNRTWPDWCFDAISFFRGTRTTTESQTSSTSETATLTSSTETQTATSSTTSQTSSSLSKTLSTTSFTSSSLTKTLSTSSETRSRTTSSFTKTSSSLTPTTTKSNTVSTTSITKTPTGLPCATFPNVCDACSSSSLASISSLSDVAALLPSSVQTIFNSKLFGDVNSIFGNLPSFPTVIAAYSSSNKMICGQIAHPETLSASRLLGSANINLGAAGCLNCLGGLDTFILKELFLSVNTSAVLKANVSVAVADIQIVRGLNLSNMVFGVTYDQGSFTFKGQASIISSIFSGTGPSAMVTLTKPSVSIDVSFDTTTWSLWTLISTMGFTSAFNGLNEPRIMSKLQQVAVLKSISGTICTASQPEGSECVSSLKIVAYLVKGDLALSGDKLVLSDSLFEGSYEKTYNSTAKFSFKLSAVWRIFGMNLTTTAALEIPVGTADGMLSKRNTIFDSDFDSSLRYPVFEEDDLASPEPSSTDLTLIEDDKHHSLAARQNTKFVVTVQAPEFPVGQIIVAISASLIPGGLSFMTSSVLDKFVIEDFLLKAILDGTDYQFRIAGSPKGIIDINLELVAGKLTGATGATQTVAALSLSTDAGVLTTIQKMLALVGKSPVDFASLGVSPASDVNMSAYLLVSATDVDLVANPSWKWHSQALSQETEIPAGLQVGMNVNFPKDCGTDKVCMTFVKVLGGAQLRVAMTIKSLTELSLYGGVNNLRITDKFILTQVGFELTVGTVNKMAFIANMAVNVAKAGSPPNNLQFGVEVAAIFTPPKVELRGYMKGLWSNAFGIPRFAVGNMVIALGITATSPVLGLPMPAFVVGGEIAFGPQPCYTNTVIPAPQYRCAQFSGREWALFGYNLVWLRMPIVEASRILCNAGQNTTRFWTNTNDDPKKCTCTCCEIAPSPPPKAACIGGAGYVGIDPSNPDRNWFGVILRNIVLSKIIGAFIDKPVTIPPIVANTGFPGDLTFSYSMLSEQEPIPGLKFPRGIFMNGDFNLFGLAGHALIQVDPTQGFKLNVTLNSFKIPADSGSILNIARSSTNLNQGPYIVIDALGTKAVMPNIAGSGFVSLLGGTISAGATLEIVTPSRFSVYLASKYGVFSCSLNVSASLSDSFSNMGVSAAVTFSGIDEFFTNVVGLINGWVNDANLALTKAKQNVTDSSNALEAKKKGLCSAIKCNIETWENKCTAWGERRHCPPLPYCAHWYNFDCWIEYAFLALCEWGSQIVETVCVASSRVVTIIVDAACKAACDAIVAGVELAQSFLDAATSFLTGLQTTLKAALNVLNLITAAIRNVFTLSSLSANLDLRVGGQAAIDGGLDVTVVGTLLQKPFKYNLRIDRNSIIETAKKLWTTYIKPTLEKAFTARKIMYEKRSLVDAGQYLPRRHNLSSSLEETSDVMDDWMRIVSKAEVQEYLSRIVPHRFIGRDGDPVWVDLQHVKMEDLYPTKP